MIEPVGGNTVPAGKGGIDTHTLYPNGSNYQRLNPFGHPSKSTIPHCHGHLMGTGPDWFLVQNLLMNLFFCYHYTFSIV